MEIIMTDDVRFDLRLPIEPLADADLYDDDIQGDDIFGNSPFKPAECDSDPDVTFSGLPSHEPRIAQSDRVLRPRTRI